MDLMSAHNAIQFLKSNRSEKFKLKPPVTTNLDLKILEIRIPSGYCDMALKIVHIHAKLLKLRCTQQK